ncbi:DNA-binding response regulator, OmpR family, contains REC and winged-helix (wHTH) domain [Clostridium amylolyticum]|uniref:Stage 0 sporulation protein A homolog n=1 Tax=Clostridium amylolyticum TaxID=1121298 RepID=A0A1M6H458_9CLOT|nr:response regulator transcription factor [Clostridium amylolyticum]SHJ16943.1 DNA-binding response regulator, OmpR family, contains REC and winged-helix (wHTH) domain [Clostridium amylolyticum]
MKESILIIEDEIGLIKMLKRLLEKEGFPKIYQAESGLEALKIIKENRIDLILLDVMLPDIDGFNLCQQIRDISDVPIIFLTARTGDIDKLTGFSVGGDDYITKPFNPLEVSARIKAILHRQRRVLPKDTNIFQTDYFTLHFDQAKLIVNGEEVSCPAMEFQLLKFMCQHPKQVFSVDQLYENIWKDYSGIGKENTVMVHISRLRQKIEKDPKHPVYLKNVRGLGYILNPENREGAQ